MKFSLVLVAGLVCTTSVFGKVSMPKELIGKYAISLDLCQDGNSWTQGFREIDKDGYAIGGDFVCSPVKIISHKKNVYKILMNCWSDGSFKAVETYTVLEDGLKTGNERYKSCK